MSAPEPPRTDSNLPYSRSVALAEQCSAIAAELCTEASVDYALGDHEKWIKPMLQKLAERAAIRGALLGMSVAKEMVKE